MRDSREAVPEALQKGAGVTKNRRGGLGRGLGALIPTSASPGAPSPTDIFFGPGRVRIDLDPTGSSDRGIESQGPIATGAEIETGADEALDPAPSARSQTTTEADPGADPDGD
ncbi:MAG: hypothetical protein JWM76_1925, partial [Pseudonocardiales bacterium]|nr:hypothetical protein [Pseudonocardiales bacterium]